MGFIKGDMNHAILQIPVVYSRLGYLRRGPRVQVFHDIGLSALLLRRQRHPHLGLRVLGVVVAAREGLQLDGHSPRAFT